MLIECLRTDKEFKTLKEEWNQLLYNSNSNNIFLTWEWMFTWWKYYGLGKMLFIVTVRDKNGRLRGVAPLCIKKIKVYGVISLNILTFLGIEEVCSDYLDFILHKESDKEVLKMIFEYLESYSKQWDYVLLSDLHESSLSFNYVRESLDFKNVNYLVSEAEVCPYITLPDSYEAYIQGLSRNMKYNLNRRTKNLEVRYKVTASALNSSDHIEKAMETLFELHRNRRNMLMKKGDFLKENLMAFHKEIASLFYEKGFLKIYYLSINGDSVSMLYGFRYNDRFLYYQSGMEPAYEKQSVGMVLMGHCIKDSIANGLKEFDFLRGPEPYKFKWTHKYRKTINISFASDSLKGKLYIEARSLLYRAKDIAKGFCDN